MTYDDLRKDLAVLILDLDLGFEPARDLAQRACLLVAVDGYRSHHGQEPRLDRPTRRRIEACTRDLFAANPSACAAERTWLKTELHRAFDSVTRTTA